MQTFWLLQITAITQKFCKLTKLFHILLNLVSFPIQSCIVCVYFYTALTLFFSITQSISDGSTFGSVYEASKSGVPSGITVPLSNTAINHQTGTIFALDIDVEANMLYYSERNSSTLWSTQLNTQTDLRVSLLNGVKAWGMAYDWINGYLYWTEDE